MDSLTPRQIVQALDRYIVGQDAAKRAIAIAVRNRWRRLRLPAALRADVRPKNLLMIGPTGVGKTEIARRMAQILAAPFVKVDATKFTEVGYVGRDVDSIVRDLVERSLGLHRMAAGEAVRERARTLAEDRILDQLLPSTERHDAADGDQAERRTRTRAKLRLQLRAGGLAERSIEVTVEDNALPSFAMQAMGLEQMGPEFAQLMSRVLPTRARRQRLAVPDALEFMTQQEIDRLVDQDSLQQAALRQCEESGIVFIDELDKVCATYQAESGPDVSRGGVQRDLLPLVEGTTVSTRYGPVRTDHILFIAAGAFTQSRPSDLMPELQGRFAVRVELDELTAEDYQRILIEPENALIKQQTALLATEGVTVSVTEEAIAEMAQTAYRVNQELENLGARRLYTVVEKVFEDIAFHASDAANKEVVIDVDYVRMRLADIVNDEERRQYEF